MADLVAHLQAVLGDRYAFVREVGTGGMAVVLLATEVKHGRSVAVKVLRPELAGVIARERFLREIRYSAEFSHPCILPLLDSGAAPAGADFPALPFYTMPFVTGESLRERIRREHQLPVDEAVAVARDVAAALDHAHGRGIIHRDIKPENIYLSGGHAVVADFGIARALQEASDPDALTSAGLVVGTPPYMSPEQAGGEPSIGARSDVYALGCVVYEMLGGEPPFSGGSAQAILARHRLDPVPSLSTIRQSVPLPVERAVMRALAKSPADRFPSAGQFAEALASPDVQDAAVAAAPRRWWAWALAALVLAAGAWYAGTRRHGEATPAAADTTRYAVLPFQRDSSVPAALQPEVLLRDGLSRWEGISLAESFQVREALGRGDTAGFTEADWRRLAAGLGAGRYVRGVATRVGDSIRIEATLYDGTGTAAVQSLRELSVRIPLDLAGAGAAMAGLADGLLLREPSAATRASGGTTSLPARQAFEAGLVDLNAWDLAAADSQFVAAVRHDPQYAAAHLWSALVGSWANPDAPATWSSAAERAAAGRGTLSPRDRRMSDAVLAMARGDVASACRTWRELTGEYPHDFVTWYGLANCLQNDRAVVPDRRSPTGWRFRSSYHEAINAYQRAYSLLPSIHHALSEESFASVVHLLLAGGTDLRGGRALPPDSSLFVAWPSWAGDSLVLYPMPYSAMGVARPATVATEVAVQHQRQRVLEFAQAWAATYPSSADALQAVAMSLQLLGDRTALDTIVKARRLARTPAEVVRVATSEVWMRVLFFAPSDLGQLLLARDLADSLLSHVGGASPPAPRLLASVAALTGRAGRAAALSRSVPLSQAWATPPALSGAAATFLTYAALGGPADSVRALAPIVAAAIDRDVLPADRDQARAAWLALPVTLAFPAVPLPELSVVAGRGNTLADAEAAFASGDTATARRLLRAGGTAASAGDGVATIDQVYPAAWLLGALGSPDSAIAELDRALGALPRTLPQLYGEVFRTGPLVRAMALRAALAAESGDRATAKAWGSTVALLWAGADPALQPVVGAMRRLTE